AIQERQSHLNEEEEASSYQLQPDLEIQCEESDPSPFLENSGIRNEELDCINEHMVQFSDESISMTVQKNGEETWVSYKYNDDNTLHSHDTPNFNDEEDVSLFEPLPNQGTKCEESDPIPSVYCTELEDDV
ncbi:hypothetical protein PJP10_31125, partial [Mycobacterium kansasii]